MSPRTGRPVQGESRKDHKLQIRMSNEELAVLDECAERMNTTRTAVVNRGVQLVKKELDEEKTE